MELGQLDERLRSQRAGERFPQQCLQPAFGFCRAPEHERAANLARLREPDVGRVFASRQLSRSSLRIQVWRRRGLDPGAATRRVRHTPPASFDSLLNQPAIAAEATQVKNKVAFGAGQVRLSGFYLYLD